MLAQLSMLIFGSLADAGECAMTSRVVSSLKEGLPEKRSSSIAYQSLQVWNLGIARLKRVEDPTPS